MTTPDDELYVDTLVNELRDELRARSCMDALELLDREADYDNGYDIGLAMALADGADIPIPKHFIEDFKTLEHMGDLQPNDVDYLNHFMVSQRARGLGTD